MKPTLFLSSIFGSRALGGKLMGVMLCLFIAHTTLAQLYINNNPQYYYEPGPPQYPQIDDTAFDNQSIFSVTYNTFTLNLVEVCDPWWGTLYYTNNGEMMINAPFANLITGNGPGTFNYETPGVDFEFNLQQTNSNVTNSMAGTFYNPGTIHCDSVLDGNNEITFLGTEFFEQTSVGSTFIDATNIIIPGNIEIGVNGLLDLNGQNVNLSRSDLIIEQGLTTSNNVNGEINSEGEGYDTNGDWNPTVDLKPTAALSSEPDLLSLTNSLPYYEDVVFGTNDLERSVFIENDNTNVPYSVYITPPLFGDAGALIQWTGTYVNPASGLLVTNYLYLFHFYIAGTNLGPIVEFGTPATAGSDVYFNYVWSQPTPMAGLPAPDSPNYPTEFDDDYLTNIYEYFNSQLVGSSVATNASVTNPSGAFTNLPGRINISASRDLNLAFAQISGANYLSLNGTNQFDGSPGAQILFPFADIHLGVTNGSMTISNLVAQNVPTWGGTLDEWSTRWTNNNAIIGFNFDFRVMLIDSDLTPTLYPQIQNLSLNVANTLAPNSTTNSLVISDILNVMTSLLVTPQSLTLTTNGIGVGASSPYGELNMENADSPTWSWGGSFPNLLWLTNNGVISMANFCDIIGSTQSVTVIPGTNAIAPSATLSEAGGTNVASQSNVTVGPGTTYTFTNSITKTSPAYSVLIGASFDASLSNLIAAINFGPGSNKVYTTNQTSVNGYATAGPLVNHAFTVSAFFTGPSENGTIPVATTATNLAWNGASLSGGANIVPPSTNITSSPMPYGAFINNYVFADQGSTIWVNNFLNSGAISNNVGSFSLSSQTATFINGSLNAGGDVSLAANTLLASNLLLQAGRSLALDVTNWLTDGGVTNGNMWSIGSTNVTGFDALGLLLPVLPTNTTADLNNLLGTTIYMESPPPNKQVASSWAGQDYGTTTLGYMTNNVAIGQLIVNSTASSSIFYFSGVGASNAIYVDRLVLENYAAVTNAQGTTVIPTLSFGNGNPGNLVIYYADAVSSGQDVSSFINGFNGNHLQWVPEYAGYFSSTNIVYPNGTTNAINAALAQDPGLDSNGNGTFNDVDPDPFFVPSEVNFKFAVVPGPLGRLTWDSIPSATNTIYYTTNMMPSTWTVVTNFVSPSAVPPVGGWPITNVVLEPLHGASHGYYRVGVTPNTFDTYGN